MIKKKKFNLKKQHNKMTFLNKVTNLNKVMKIPSAFFQAFVNFDCPKILISDIMIC